MKWDENRDVSDNVEDGRGGGFASGGLKIGIGGLVAIGLLSLITGQNFFSILGPVMQSSQQQPQTSNQPYQGTPQEEKQVKFVSFVLDDTEKVWSTELPKYGVSYVAPKLHLFTDGVRTACGDAQSAMGPFYCPADQKVYIDLNFYKELQNRFGAKGEFAQAYVVAHEVGHHVQNLLGYSDKISQLQQQYPAKANQLSVRLELQADCYAGVWAKSTDQRGILEPGDIQDGMNAAASVGDDHIQEQMTGQVRPERWTHGSSAQREAWFMQGYQTGDLRQCDTYSKHLPQDS